MRLGRVVCTLVEVRRCTLCFKGIVKKCGLLAAIGYLGAANMQHNLAKPCLGAKQMYYLSRHLMVKVLFEPPSLWCSMEATSNRLHALPGWASLLPRALQEPLTHWFRTSIGAPMLTGALIALVQDAITLVCAKKYVEAISDN